MAVTRFKDLPRIADLKKSGYDSLATVAKELMEQGKNWDVGFMRAHRINFPKVFGACYLGIMLSWVKI